MKLGVFTHGWWKEACAARSIETVPLPVPATRDGNAYTADLNARLAHGSSLLAGLRDDSIAFLLDNGGTGLIFVPGREGVSDIRPAHETAGKLLVSHFIDPVTVALQGLDWAVAWQCLRSTGWVKAVWDAAHAAELQRFGVPNVVHLPMAAPNRPYCTEPLDPDRQRPVVSFIGGQNSHFFQQGSIPGPALFAGTLAHAVRTDLPHTLFFDIYHGLYGLGQPIDETDDLPAQFRKTADYFNRKLAYHAALCVRNRDRFVLFLKRHLGDKFELIGRGWDASYGLPARPPLPSADAYFRHFRDTAVNLNLVSGNAETGLNMRHFEITAAGGFLLCYQQPELGEYFEIGKECVAFRNEADLLDKIEYYLAHPDERIAIAQAGQRRTLSEHLYSHRLERLLGWITAASPQADETPQPQPGSLTAAP